MPPRSPKALLPAMVLGLLAASTSAQVTKVAGGYRFRAKLAKGSVISWDLTGRKIAGGGGPISVASPFVMRVLSTSKESAFVRARSGPVKLNGKVFQPATVSEGNLDWRLRPLGGGDQAGAFSGMYPERAIPIGGSWTAPLQITTGNLPGNSVATYRLQHFATVDGVRVAILQTTLAGLLKGTGQTMIGMADGIPRRMTLTLGLTYTRGPGKETPMQLKFDVLQRSSAARSAR